MRVAVMLVLAALIVGLALAPGPERIDAEPVQAGLAALHAAGVADVHVLEAVLAAGSDPHDWYGTDLLAQVAIPAPDSDPITGLYELAVVTRTGIDPTAWPDPVRGTIDLQTQLLDNVDAALASRNDAVHSFQLLAMAHAGLEHQDAIPRLRDALLVLQHPDGSWGCGPWVGPECTSYALRALAATGGIPEDSRAAAVSYIEGRLEGDAYSDPLNGVDIQITANAIRGLVASGAPVPTHVIDALLAQQTDGMWHKAGRPSPWATAEVLVALSEAGVR